MNNIEHLDDRRPHVTIVNGNKGYVIPVAFFQDVVTGRQSITDLENLDDIMPVIIGRWLESIGVQDSR